MDVRAKFGDSTLNSDRIIRLFGRPETASNVISGTFIRPIVRDKCVNFVILALTVLEKFNPKQSDASFAAVFRTFI